ncbi:MAG: ABC transporter ATP-binding protein [Spirochaetales bacterium]|nr:ABC transporter ATP-binding protein [Spirochaetales bacterium]
MCKDFLVLKQLVKEFGSGNDIFRAVDEVNLTVDEGELITLLGPSGCGKTTTLRMIAGFHTPSGGEIFIDGEEVSSIPPNKRPTSMVFQNYALFPHMTVKENVAYGLKIRKDSKQEVERKSNDIIKLLGLDGLQNRQPAQLSGGQQQRVSLARAMVMEPKLLLFDEPLSNLDAKLRVSTRLEIRKLQQRVGITSVYVTHDQEEAMTLSDRVVIMKDGKIQQIGKPAEIYAHPANLFVAGFIGKANFLEAKVKSIDGDYFTLDVHGVTCRAPYWNQAVAAGDSVELVVRPESIIPEEPDDKLLQGRILDSVYFGSHILYEIQISQDKVITIEVSDPQQHIQYPVGTRVGLVFKEKSLHVIPKE